MSSIRVVLGLVASLDLELEQLDVKTAFLHGDLDEEIYMEQPKGFEKTGKEHMVCRLKKSLYGLKQAPRQWYKKFDSFMESHGYTKTDADHCVLVKKFPGDKIIILLLYVDDMLIVGHDMKLIGDMKKDLAKSFEMKDLGPAKQILGMQIMRDRKSKNLWLSQERQSALNLSKNAMYHSRTKHIDVRYHWLRQAVEEQQFKLEKIHTEENPADMMTKVVTGGKLQLCAELIGMECM
ncbi:cysteine-rich RLK (RECEPTOR-like protein kinase) 8 [Striga hermonthica]|uniref:Cysteine-rich RLK (RECEPTOR-like protein kinase) 8 n=1 Tax=Striga hermonthica TaxID=68872 RepID=A0A9N7MPT8_STRHE|nr:cysteine-rich RLK (RECEPTOR-like protein kinase) 8 [Striga hermonthica]